MLLATVSGSFHRHISEIGKAVRELVELGVQVLSPRDPEVVDNLEDFLFVASDRFRSVRLVQDRHLESIRASDFLWLVTPDGYVGQSASMELGFAVASGIPIFSTAQPADLTLRQYVHIVPCQRFVVDTVSSWSTSEMQKPLHFLINPHDSIDAAYQTLGQIERALSKNPRELDDAAARKLYSRRDELVGLFAGLTRKG